eukprot:GHUV01038987.1.p1 GENE.GHUV01038987.1~~GHUV01038987.1.p1  ORF type:complete len:190 (+),score=30.54 GHUV01038987.1:161-730(+)
MAAVLKKQASSAGAGLSVDVPLLIEQPKLALLPVLKRLDGWQEAVEETITVEQFSGAMTNMVYRCGLQNADGVEQQVVLMRVHASSSDLFDRQEEIETFRGVSAAGMGPKLLMLFENGRVEEFLAQHVTLAASDLQDSMVGSAIAATLAPSMQSCLRLSWMLIILMTSWCGHGCDHGISLLLTTPHLTS